MAVDLPLDCVEVAELTGRVHLPCHFAAAVPEEIVIGHWRAVLVVAAEEILQDLLMMERGRKPEFIPEDGAGQPDA